jgi:hypothetical protein
VLDVYQGKNVLNRSCKENKTYILCSLYFSVYVTVLEVIKQKETNAPDVDGNRRMLSRVADYIKFCSMFRLALCGHSETCMPQNFYIFLYTFSNTAVFKGTSKTV